MIKAFAIAILSICATQAHAQAQFSLQAPAGGPAAPEVILGSWGTAAQCEARAAGRFENPSLYPYEISDEWIRHGWIYCYLAWRDRSDEDGVVEARAYASCGEDNLRDYRLTLKLQQDRLRIRWSPDFATGELSRCG